MALNNFTGIGRLTRDPDITMVGDTKKARATVAIDRSFKTKDGVTADFVPVTAFGRTAEKMEKYCTKGVKILISQAHIQTGSYEKDGKRVYTLDVIVDQFEFPESKGTGTGSGTSAQPAASAPAAAPAPTPAPAGDDFMGIPDESYDDELPFN